MKKWFSSCDPQQCLDWALLILRIAFGIIFIFHGYGKLFGHAPGMTGFTKMVTGIGFPLAGFFAYMAALAEFVGGIAVLLGICPRLFAAFISINMLVAIIAVKKFALPSIDPDLALLSIAITFMLVGAGKYSVMGYMKKSSAPAMAS